MLTVQEKLDIQPVFDFSLIGEREDLLFFDIETTGLSAYKAGLYLIGCVYWEDGSWQLTQYFAESVADEVPILSAFFALLAQRRTLVSFNGDGFDLPFISALTAQYHLGYSFEGVTSFDIFKYVKPLKTLLSLPNCKLKSCERFLGIFREDRFSGGELIYVYQDYLESHDPDKLKLLLLHNAEDLANLPLVLPILNYRYLLNGPLTLEQEELVTLDTPAAAFCTSDEDQPDAALPCRVLDLRYRSEVSVPVPIDLEYSRYTLNLTQNRVNLCVRLFEGELKYFYPDYKNYYYLPVEDCAVHKSVGAFVDPGARARATAKNCYTKKTGLFMPMLQPVFTPIFYKEYKGKIPYALYTPGLFQDQLKAQAYLKDFLGKCMRK